MTAGTPRPSSPENTPEALDTELRATLGRGPAPCLTPGFEARLAARVATGEAVPERPDGGSWPARLLPAYWLATALASRWIVAEVEWTAVTPSGVWCLTTAALALLLPTVVVAWQARAPLR